MDQTITTDEVKAAGQVPASDQNVPLKGKSITFETRLSEIFSKLETQQKNIDEQKLQMSEHRTIVAVGFVVLLVMVATIVIDVTLNYIDSKEKAPIIIYTSQSQK